LSTLGSQVTSFSIQRKPRPETTKVVLSSPIPLDTAYDLLVCWVAGRERRGWLIDSLGMKPSRSYHVWNDSGTRRITPLAGDLAVVAVFTHSETMQVTDVQVEAINAPTGRVTQGATVTPQAVVRNNGTQTASFPVRFRIGSVYLDSVSVTLPVGAVAPVSFSPWTATHIGMFPVTCTTCLPRDAVPMNNWRTDSVVVAPPDTGAFSIELIWKDGRADLDLYLILPTRQGTADTVWWKRRQAQGCMLDVDDREGYGPEKISGPVSLAMPESAKVGVHYFGPSDGVSTQAKVLFYRNRILVGQKGWYALSSGNWWNVGFPNLRAGTPGFLAKRSVLKTVKNLSILMK